MLLVDQVSSFSVDIVHKSSFRMVAASARRADLLHPSSICPVVLFHPGLSAHLNRVPGTAERGRVAEVEVVQLVYAHAVKQGGGKDVNAFGDF